MDKKEELVQELLTAVYTVVRLVFKIASLKKDAKGEETTPKND